MVDLTERNIIMNKPDEQETENGVRQVVTGHDAIGRAVIARDEQIDGMPIPGLGELAVLWSADEPATYPNAGNNPGGTALFPPVGGIRFIMTSYSANSVVAPEPTPGMHAEDGDALGMHRTDTTDFGVLLSGNLVVEVDDGAKVLLSPGDVVVRTELATVGAWLGTCRPPLLLSSSEPTAFRIRRLLPP
jgi:hypothetical protein